MNGRRALKVIAIGLAVYGFISMFPDIRRYIRISMM
jgi:hypothetical protein